MHYKFFSTLSLWTIGNLAAGAAGAPAGTTLPLVRKAAGEKAYKAASGAKLPAIAYFDNGFMDKRDPKDNVALRTSDSFYYGTHPTNPVANVTVHVPGGHEHMLSMERFAGMLSHVDCTDPDLMMDFENKEDFENAKESWSWVNDHQEHRFLMVANYPGCGPTNERLLYQVTGISYDEDLYKVFMEATQVTWEESFRKYEISANTKGLISSYRRRWGPDVSFDPDVSTDLTSDFSGTFLDAGDIDVGEWGIHMSCGSCGTTGTVDFALHISGDISGIDEASFSITPSSLSVYMEALALGLAAKKSSGYQKNFQPVALGLTGIETDLLHIGPQLSVDVGMDISHFEGAGTVLYGTKLTVPDNSTCDIDFLDSDNFHWTWGCHWDSDAPKIDAALSANADIYTGVSLDFEIGIPDETYSAGIILKAPDLTADVTIEHSDSGEVCDGTIEAENAAGVALSLGVDVAVTAIAPDVKTISKDLYTFGTEIYSTCIGFGHVPTQMPSPVNGTEAMVTPPPRL